MTRDKVLKVVLPGLGRLLSESTDFLDSDFQHAVRLLDLLKRRGYVTLNEYINLFVLQSDICICLSRSLRGASNSVRARAESRARYRAENPEKLESASDAIQVSVPAARPGLRVQRLFRGSLAGKTATIAVAIAVVPGLRTGWTARLRKWPLVLHSGNSVRETLAATSSSKVVAHST